MKTTIKQDKKLTITVTYNNEPSDNAIKQYAQVLKKIIDSKVIAS
jgi:hypothetical protein